MADQQLTQEDIPHGYQINGTGALVINETEAAVVRDLFQTQVEHSQQKRVFIYARLAQEDERRLEEQVKACFNFCQEKGYRGVDIFQAFGPGNTLDNEVLSQMRSRYDEVDAVVVIDHYRLSRDAAMYQTLVQEMQQHHIELICVNE